MENDDHTNDDKRYMLYYRKRHYIQTMRAVLRVWLIAFFVVNHNPNIFAGMAIALWAFVIIFGSFFVYVHLISRYTPWHTVKIDTSMGEIIQITPLYLQILWKNTYGERTGEMINIPNHEVRQKQITIIDLKSTAIEKVSMIIPYTMDHYAQWFDLFIDALEDFLESVLMKNTAKRAENYKSYKGHKYKISFDVDRDGVAVRIGFLCQRKEVTIMKRKIITYVESIKQPQTEYDLQKTE